ncbi:Tol-Pal system beta propeller repeat protein TolB [Dongia sp.]|uniref:Tol-Pal system beta propeller repeat protein TolB n=1 Tax=Dongia sp. TaxID=1977262 RepID=UPI0035B05FFD
MQGMRQAIRGMAIVFAILVVPMTASAEPKIIIQPGKQPVPMPIAVPDFFAASPNDSQLARDVAAVIAADLERSGLFAPIDKRAFIQDPASLQQGPRYQDWRLINAEALIAGAVATQPNGTIRVEARLFDVFGQTEMGIDPGQTTGMGYTVQANSWRRGAHLLADDIYARITGETGYFDSRIVYISETGPKQQRIKRLAIMDQDGENHKILTDGSALVLTPRFSPVSQEITYMSYYGNKPRVYIFNINTGQQEILGDFPGMTFAPRFSPDGARVIMSMAQGGNTDIYTMDTRTRRTQRITNTPGIDTAPSYSPDGSQITFESDRGGSQQVYVMNADGSNSRRISKGQGAYGTPVWSPRGDLIAFTRIYQGSFYIGVMRPDGSGERMLSQGWLIEGPTWAPNGRVLAFFKQDPSGKTQVHSIDLTGFNERVMKTPLDGSDPAWSPLLENQ